MQKEEGILTSVSNRDERYLEEKEMGHGGREKEKGKEKKKE